MPYKSLNEFIAFLEEQNELIRVSNFVNPELSISEITDRISKQEGGGKALLFENSGTDFPVLVNAFGSNKRMCMALGVDDLDEIGDKIDNLFKSITSPKENLINKLSVLPKLAQLASWMPKSISKKGICQEVINLDPDITKLPVLKCWPEDGGRFVTLPMVNTKDPITGIRNIGMYRMQIFDKKLTGMHWHMHKVGARHYNEYKKLGKNMPVAVALGGDPVYTYSATAPLPDNVDEYMLAGFLRNKKVELVKCITQDIEVPADADIIIEGYVDTQEDFIWEGPFGDHTGFYSLEDWYPKFHITCITHRKDAVYPATVVGIPPQEDAWIGKATERIFLTPIKISMLPEITDMDLPVAGVAHNLAIVKIKSSFYGHALKVMNALWGAGQMMFNKVLVIVDQEVDIHNYFELAKIVSKNVDPANDIHFSKGPLDVLDHSSQKYAFGGKMFIDATEKPESDKKLINKLEKEKIEKEIFEAKGLNLNIIDNGIPVGLLSINKAEHGNIHDLLDSLIENTGLRLLKTIIVVDHLVDVNSIMTTLWVTLNNIDPSRDCQIITSRVDNSTLIIDGTRKTMQADNFKKDWPNVVTSDIKTIDEIDKVWSKLGLGDFIESPSLKFLKLKYSGGAIAKD